MVMAMGFTFARQWSIERFSNEIAPVHFLNATSYTEVHLPRGFCGLVGVE